MDEWRLLAQGDTTGVPEVTLESGRDHRLELELPVAVPAGLVADALAGGIRSVLGAFLTVRSVAIAGATVTIELVG
jgi:hypothetical protein